MKVISSHSIPEENHMYQPANDNSIRTAKKIHQRIQHFLQLFHYCPYLTWSRKNSKGHRYISMLTAPVHSPGTIPVVKNQYGASLYEENNQGRASTMGAISSDSFNPCSQNSPGASSSQTKSVQLWGYSNTHQGTKQKSGGGRISRRPKRENPACCKCI